MSVSGFILQEADLELGVSVRSAFSCHSLSLTCGACQIAQFKTSACKGQEVWEYHKTGTSHELGPLSIFPKMTWRDILFIFSRSRGFGGRNCLHRGLLPVLFVGKIAQKIFQEIAGKILENLYY